MSGDPEPKKVPEPSYQDLKTKINNAAKFIDSQCNKYKDEKRVVTNYDEKDALNRHLKNAQEALGKYERLRKRTKDSENGGGTEKAEYQHQKHRSALRALKNFVFRSTMYVTLFFSPPQVRTNPFCLLSF